MISNQWARQGGAAADAPPRVLGLVARRADEAGKLAELLAVRRRPPLIKKPRPDIASDVPARRHE